MEEPGEEPTVALGIRLGPVESLVAVDQREELLQLLSADRTHLDPAHRR
jgi:hypothetical protein